ncbi:MAG: 5'/3'-nucleotidase SurE [Pseudomonadota bacterium]
MRILITNDDGIQAPGFQTLEKIAQSLAGDQGEVWAVAPAFEQSGVGHCVSYTRPFLTSKMGPRRFAVEGTPADCVLTAVSLVMADAPPDLVLSGVNRGNNSAENVLYSGTIGAAMEAALQGLPAIALSQYYGPDNRDLEDPFEASLTHGAEVVKAIISKMSPTDDTSYSRFFNVNFPAVPAHAVKGAKLVPQGLRMGARFGAERQASPSGKSFVWVRGGSQHVPATPGSDADVNLDGYISVTPMRADLTDWAALEDWGTGSDL